MFTFSSYDIISWFLVYFIIGANLYVLDKRYGVYIYNKYKKLISPNMENYVDDYTKGFIYNRRTRVKILWSSNISFILSLSVFLGGYTPLPVELVMFFIEIPFTFLGMMVGPFYGKILNVSSQTVDKLDVIEKQVENGTLEENTKHYINETVNDIKDSFNKTMHKVSDEFSTKETNVKEKEKEVKTNNYQDTNDAINNILGKK